jgi:hypothetical protein
MKIALIVVAILTLSNMAFAKSLQCDVTDITVGAPSFMIIVPNNLNANMVESVVLTRNLSARNLHWKSVDGVGAASESNGNLKVYTRDDNRAPWTDQECFRFFDSYGFDLTWELSPSGPVAKGILTTSRQAIRNPKGKCPVLIPPRGADKSNVECREF